MNLKELLNINNSIIDNLQDCCKFIYKDNIEIIKKENTIVNHIDFIKENRVFKNNIEIDLKGYENSWEINVYAIYKEVFSLVFHKTCFNNKKVIILPFDNIIEIFKKIFQEVCNEK